MKSALETAVFRKAKRGECVKSIAKGLKCGVTLLRHRKGRPVRCACVALGFVITLRRSPRVVFDLIFMQQLCVVLSVTAFRWRAFFCSLYILYIFVVFVELLS